MNTRNNLLAQISAFINETTGQDISVDNLVLGPTKKEFEGDFTLLVFPFARFFKKSPEQTGQVIGEYLMQESRYIKAYNVIKGFLNLTVSKQYWEDILLEI